MTLDTEDLVDAWGTSPKPSIKTTSYSPVYTNLFRHLRNKKCTFIEIGVLERGSLFVWKKWLGPEARIIGIDLNPEAKKWESSGFEIFIGDQAYPNFWNAIFSEIGRFDAFLDDGGRQSFQQMVRLQQAIHHSEGDCVIAIEDTYTSFMNDFQSHKDISFFNGIVAFHIAPDLCLNAAIVRNKQSSPIKDFRYEGLNQAAISWPNILRKERVVVEGPK